MESNDTGWMTARQAARHLGLATRQLYSLIDEGALPAYRVGDDLKLAPADVAAYADAK